MTNDIVQPKHRTDIDYREILKTYIAHVLQHEGAWWFDAMEQPYNMTIEQWCELYRVAKEAGEQLRAEERQQ